jgi:hypothetical protein
MASLLTKDEIVAISFKRKIDLVKIPDRLAESVQSTHIKPVLGADLYDKVIATPSSYSALIDYLKPVIAYFVKYYILPEIWIDISTTGVNKIQGNNRTIADSEEFGTARQDALDMANKFMSDLTDYLNDNTTLYPDYYYYSNPGNKVNIVGGIIYRPDIVQDADDYYINSNY